MQLFFDGCTSSLGSLQLLGWLLVVTISFVIATNITILKPFKTAMGQRQPCQSGNGSKWRSLMRIDGEPLYAVMLSAVFQQCWKNMCFSRHPKPTKQASIGSSVATVSTECVTSLIFVPLGSLGLLRTDLFSDWLSYRWPILLSQCWAVENAHISA